MNTHRIITEHRNRNRLTRDAYERFAHHRNAVMRLLTPAPTPDGRLCLLGAGNANDVDIRVLLESYRQIELVDIDREALEVVHRRAGRSADRLKLRGDFDTTGLCELLEKLTPETPPTDAQFDELIETAATAPRPKVDQLAHVTASLGLLPELVDTLVRHISVEHPRFVELLQTVRRRHLSQLLELTHPGGHAVLVTDMVSSLTAEQLKDADEEQLPQLMLELTRENNFLTGLNPVALLATARDDGLIAPLVESAQLSPPWRFELFDRVYLDYALVMKRSTRRRVKLKA